MDDLVTIGALAQQCGLSRSALRFYDDCGLLRPVAVDGSSGYRYYALTQVEDALLVKRLRAAEMPVADVREFLVASPGQRKALLDLHAARLEQRAEALRRALGEVYAALGSPPPPGPAPFSKVPGCTVQAGALIGGLREVRFAAAPAELRPDLAGVLVEARGGSLRLVATDSYRLAVRDLVVVPGAQGAILRGFIPLEKVDELSSLLAGVDAVSLSQGCGGDLRAVFDGHALEIGERNGLFPDYEHVLNGLAIGHRCVADRRSLAGALAGDSGTSVVVNFAPGSITLSSDEKDLSVPASWDGPEISMTINPA
ncbi:MAG TPA: MerR family transcriptional regulator, partial [Acidimicrobiales bacterium]|nr:MerR family transcriptional regulator [Acidimicrobiales bacterium]